MTRALLFFVALALSWTWPLVTRLSWRIPHDPGDPILNTWILWWNTQAVPFTAAWWSPPVFYPMPGALALSEHLAGIAVFTTPLQLAGLPPLGAYNVALILSAALSGYFAFLLGRHLTGSTFGGLIAGIAFGFAPYRASQLAHLQVLTAQWMPLALFAMHRYLDDGRRRWLLVFAVAWVLQALSNGYYLLFFPPLIGLWLLWFVRWRTAARRGIDIAGTFVAASLLLVPTLLQYKAIHDALGLRRTLGEIRMFSAKLWSFSQTADLLAFWPSVRFYSQEGFLFTGVTVAALTVAGLAALVLRRQVRQAVSARSPLVFYSGAALVFAWLSLGPGDDLSLAHALIRPYTALMWLPGFDGLRVPARFAMMVALCLAIATAIAAVRLAPGRRPLRIAAGAVVLVALFVDTWIEPLPMSAPPQRALAEVPPGAVVLELPADDERVNVAAMYRSISHQRPLVNGYSGHTPPHYALLTRALRRDDPTILTSYARGRPLVVIVHRREDPERAWRTFVEGAGGVLREESGVGPVYVIPPQPSARTPPLGDDLTATPIETEAGYAAIDLGAERTVRAITIALRWRYAEIGAKLTVETSPDGVNWSQVWEDWTGERALAGALEDQRLIPMRIYLDDVRARYIRVTPAPPWVAHELTASAPR
ncbi:MAG TPA: hypothetical protein VGD94_06510 [Vicinamibacterales bacterium]